MGAHKNSYTEKELKSLYDEFCARDKLILDIGLSSGLRIADILHLKRSEVFKGVFTITERKTKKKKKICLSKETVEKAKRYDKLHHIKNSRFLFVSPITKKPYTRQAIYYHFSKLAKLMDSNTSIHSMRSTYAKRIMTKTKSLQKVQKALNHSNSSTTQIYLQPNK